MTDPDEDLEPVDRIRAVAHRDVARIVATWPAALVDALAVGYGTGRTYDGTSSGGPSIEVDGERIPATTVEATALADHPDFATGWLAELGDVLLEMGCPSTVTYLDDAIITAQVDRYIDWRPKPRRDRDVWNGWLRRLHYLAEQARSWWPDPPTPGSTVRGVTVGTRGNQVETCALCGDPVVSGRDEAGQSLLRYDKDGAPYHAAGKGCYWQVWRHLRRREGA